MDPDTRSENVLNRPVNIDTADVDEITADLPTSDDSDSAKLIAGNVQPHELAKSRLITIEPVMLLMSVYAAATFSLTDQYVRSRVAQSMNYNTSDQAENCTVVNESSSAYIMEKHIQSATSLWLMYLNSSSLVPAFFSTLILASYSDKAGRKIAILLPLVGMMIKVVNFFLVIWFRLPLSVLFVGCVAEGVSGGLATLLAASFAYLVDITSVENRSLRIVILEACLGLGLFVTQVGLGYIISALGFLYPFAILLGVCALNFAYTACVLQESVRARTPVRLLSVDHFTKPFRLFLQDDGSGRRWRLQLVLCAHFLFSMVVLTQTDIQLLYTIDFPFCWDSVRIGLFAALNVLLSAPTGIALTKLLQKRITDLGLLFLGIVFGIAYQLLIAFSLSTAMLFIVTIFGAPNSLMTPMVRSISSKLVKHDEEGAVFACIGWIQLLSVFIGGAAFDVIYAETVHVMRGLVFIVMASIYMAAALIVTLFAVLQRAEKKNNLRKKLDIGHDN